MASSAGTKVTNDPESVQKPIQESAGVVTADSLAAESHNQGGGFSAAPGPQPSKSTTTNTTDTSNATDVKPGDRSGDHETYTGPPSGGKDAGVGPTYNKQSSTSSGGAADRAADKGATQSKGDSAHKGSTVSNGDAVSNIESQRAVKENRSHETPASGAPEGVGNTKAKGKNLTEGGFDGNEPNASFNNEIGTENDPGRAALEKIQRANADSSLNSGTAKDTQQAEAKTGVYDTLEETSA